MAKRKKRKRRTNCTSRAASAGIEADARTNIVTKLINELQFNGDVEEYAQRTTAVAQQGLALMEFSSLLQVAHASSSMAEPGDTRIERSGRMITQVNHLRAHYCERRDIIQLRLGILIQYLVIAALAAYVAAAFVGKDLGYVLLPVVVGTALVDAFCLQPVFRPGDYLFLRPSLITKRVYGYYRFVVAGAMTLSFVAGAAFVTARAAHYAWESVDPSHFNLMYVYVVARGFLVRMLSGRLNFLVVPNN